VNDELELFQLLAAKCKEYYGKKDESDPSNRRSC
jgi:hypothetical protein